MDDVLTVYYDGACPICRREIGWYRRMSGGDTIAWVDIAGGDDLGPGLTREAAMGRFHARLPDGALVSGGAAFGAIWMRLPRLRWLGHVSRTRAGGAVLERLYRVFLRLLPLIRRLAPRQGLRKTA